MKLRLFVLLILSAVFFSCTADEEIPSNGAIPEGEEVMIRCALSVPFARTAPVTRVQLEEEMAINTLQLLVFQDGVYKYSADLSGINTSNGETTFYAKVQTSSSVVTFYVIANADEALANFELTVGLSEGEVIRGIRESVQTTGIYSAFPMSGKFTFSEGLDMDIAKTPIEIKLLRAVARVDLSMEPNVTNFRIATIQAFRVNSEIQVMPNDLPDFRNPVVHAPSVPATSTRTIGTSQLTVTNNKSEAQLYVAESVSPPAESFVSEATCIVVGGYFNNSNSVSYYRIDFNSGSGSQNLGQVLRNHRYVFRLTSVSGDGYNTAGDAANNKANNMEVTVQDWSDETTYMVFDGENYFSIATRNIELGYRANSAMSVNVDTDLPSCTINWGDTGNADQLSSSSQITNTYFDAKLVTENEQVKLVVTALQKNTEKSNRQQFLTIFAGDRWKILIEINQLPISDYTGTYINILSVGTSYGSFGSNMIGTSSSSGTLANGIRPILENKANFGPAGVVPIAGISFGNHLTEAQIGNASIAESASFLRLFDIINLSYSINVSATGAENIYNWLQGSPDRVLVLSRDNTTTNTNVIKKLAKEILGQESVVMFEGDGTSGTNANAYIPDRNADNDYFTQSGPFGAMTGASKSATFRILDAVWQGLLSDSEYAQKYITPLAVYESKEKTYYMISVDKTNRIIYITDSNLYQSRTPGFSKSDGSVDYDQAKMIANVFAWAIEEVILPGKGL